MVRKFNEGDVLHKKFGFYLYYFIIVFLAIFAIINFYFPYLNIQNIDLSLMISTISFLFGFLISISFSMILSRTSSLRDSLSIETGRLISMFNLSKSLGKEFHEEIKNLLDEYTICTLNNYNQYGVSRPIIDKIFNVTSIIQAKTDLQKIKADSFLTNLNDFVIAREKIESLTQEKLLFTIKITNYVLAILLIFLLYLNRGTYFSNLLFVILSTVIVFLLLIIQDYEDLRIGDYISNISNSEQIFDIIGKERYYPSHLLGRVKLTDGQIYRIGFINKKTGEEKIVHLKYSSKFRFP